MAKGKNFFYRVNPCEVLAEVVFAENKEQWFMQFFHDLKNDNPDSAKIGIAADIIKEAHGFRDKRSTAGKASAEQRANKEQQESTYVQHMLPDVEHNVNKGATSKQLAVSSNQLPEPKEEKHLSPDKPDDPPVDRIPYDDIMNAYNKFCPSFSRAMQMTDPRRRAVRIRWLQHKGIEGGPLAFFDALFKKAESSDFLTGRVDRRGGKFGFDWVINPQNIVKIMEGNYDNGAKRGRTDAEERAFLEGD